MEKFLKKFGFINRFFSFPKNQQEQKSSKIDYINRQYEYLLDKKNKQESVAFRIIDIKEKGFKVKTAGLFAHISFNHMPWKTFDRHSWQILFPYLKNKVFFAKIYKLYRDENRIVIILDGKIPQFGKPHLITDQKYKAVAFHKSRYGLFVDLGYHFNWKSGHLPALIHKSQFDDKNPFEDQKVGVVTEVIYWGINEKGQYMAGIDPDLKDWFTGTYKQMVGEEVNVRVVVTDDGKKTFWVKDQYKATLPFQKSIYPNQNKNKIKTAISKLQDGQIIRCRVIGTNSYRRAFKLKWISDEEIEKTFKAAGGDYMKDETGD